VTYVRQHSLAGDAEGVIDAGIALARDPALIEFSCELIRLSDLIEGDKPDPPCKRRVYTAADKKRGVGLAYALPPLRAVIQARQNPGLAVAIGVGVVGTLVYAGYLLGRRRR